MRQVEILVPAKGNYRHVALYFCLILATATFIMLYSSPISSHATAFFSRVRPYVFPLEQVDELEDEQEEEQAAQEGFLVYSDGCKIPDLDPFHPSIRHMIDYSDPIDCYDYAPFTTTKHNILLFNYTIAKSKGIENFTCCYKVLSRDRDGDSDNSYRLSEDCTDISNGSEIPAEFIEVDCGDKKGLFHMDFHSFIHDKSDVENRCKRFQAKYNVLIIGVDAVSRLNMHRQLSKTSRYLLSNMGAMEMFGFNKVGYNTFPNLIPLLTGYDVRELPQICWNSTDYHLDKCDYMWDRFAQKGYRTLYAEDTPSMSTFNYEKEGFAHQPTDYYFRNFIQAYEENLGRKKPYNCKLCVGTVSQTEAVLSWVEKFVTHFRNRSYFAFAWINSMTHDNLNTGSMGDHIYEAFFRNLHSSGILDNTIIMLMGDHGMRWGEIRTTYIGRLEERLPMLMITLPDNFKRDYPSFTRTLKKNRNRLVTPFDLYATLDHILHIDEEWNSVDMICANESLKKEVKQRSRSIFKPIPLNRTCKEAYIDKEWCTCEMSLPADTKSNKVKQIGKFLLNEINSILNDHRNNCALLQLVSIEQAQLWTPPANMKDNSPIKSLAKNPPTSTYTVVIKATPGNGMFEGIVRLKKKRNPERLGTISRLSIYGNQSSCVHDVILKRFCYCV